MEQKNEIFAFEENKIRSVWHNNELFFSIIDVIALLSESKQPSRYWHELKKQLNKEGVKEELFGKIEKLKMPSLDGKERATEAANRQTIFRIIQSIPSPKAEPFKMWLAQIAEEHIQEVENPELGFERLKEIYKAKGYPDDWIENRLKSIDIRKQLTTEWQKRGVKEGQEYAILTSEIAKATFGVTPNEHAKLKGLEKENLRDHMTDLELVFTMLGEVITKNLAEKDNAQGFEENHEAAQRGGSYAGTARKNLEQKEKIKVVSSKNFKNLNDTDVLNQIEKPTNED
jgi:DNA-damage-inducible protein D